MRRVWLLAVNDLRLTMRDRPAFIWMIVMPVAMMWFLGNMGGGGGASDPKISLSVVNQDSGWLSTALIEELADESINMEKIDPALSDTRKRTASACSSGVVALPVGIVRVIFSRNRSETVSVTNGVMTRPGQTAFTLIPYGANS